MFHTMKPLGTGIRNPKSPIAALPSLGRQCPCCSHSLEEDHDQKLEDLYTSDEFRMYHFKVDRCTLTRLRHDWTDCPYLHEGEKARRRDPRRFDYSGKLCTEFKKNGWCTDRDKCKFAHGVFEMWLHPDSYRTQLCRDGMTCKRKVCFFAHSFAQLRLLSDTDSYETGSEMSSVTATPSDDSTEMLSSFLSVIIDNMQRTRLSEIGNGIFCGIDMFQDGRNEVPDVKWVSDLLDF
ncbi:hypothetical protein LUZ63_009115 [Rhynchospora breviuscula]|uniref:C3H1-type domain-containing protein n=1 Tax=Rhynchospora breviuscula TaxID=2022672 RepID=A0A9Q0CEE5_9POAL|nr:hypothetical protein LUZ63_009115 [Rhynchospora breviuscula]